MQMKINLIQNRTLLSTHKLVTFIPIFCQEKTMHVAVDQVGKNLIDCCVFLLNSIVSQYHFTFETVKYYGANKRRSLPDGVDKLNFVYTKVNLAGTEAAGDVRSFMHVHVSKKKKNEIGGRSLIGR